MTAPTVRLTSPGEILATVPSLLGFHPSESVVLVGIDGKRVAVTVRGDLDWPAEVYADALDRIRPHVSGVIVAAYADTMTGAAAHATDVEALARAAGFDVPDVLAVADGRWTSCLCPSPTCCPPEGRPLPESSAASTALAVEGKTVAADRAALVAEVEPATVEPDARPALADLLTPDADDYRTRDLYLGRAAEAGPETCATRHGEVAAAARALPVGDPQRVHLLTCAAVLAYCAGDGGRANVALTAAEAEAVVLPTLAGLLGQFLALAVPPDAMRAALAQAVPEILAD